ncbi:contact-dependent growth inhibition system immunity protein [Xenorhabdus stockiae]|uniref:contact-dependent growth inhibition system immunity protein n=1 Tax=Xenorhabdus stockiae TaxID=351614 RepID=UPI003CF33BB5
MKMENICYLLGCYFHQDWDLEASTDEGIIRLFVEKEQPETVMLLKKEFEEILNNGKELSEDFLYENNGYYPPSADGLTVLEWFKKLHDAL